MPQPLRYRWWVVSQAVVAIEVVRLVHFSYSGLPRRAEPPGTHAQLLSRLTFLAVVAYQDSQSRRHKVILLKQLPRMSGAVVFYSAYLREEG